jgi:hypothetical protein
MMRRNMRAEIVATSDLLGALSPRP